MSAMVQLRRQMTTTTATRLIGNGQKNRKKGTSTRSQCQKLKPPVDQPCSEEAGQQHPQQPPQQEASSDFVDICAGVQGQGIARTLLVRVRSPKSSWALANPGVKSRVSLKPLLGLC